MSVLLLSVGTGTARADEAEQLEKRISLAHGDAKIVYMIQRYQLSLLTDDVQRQVSSLNAAVDEARRQQNDEKLAALLAERAQFFYNRGMRDSVVAYVPNDRETLARMKEWNRYYEVWTHLVNTYIYFNKNKTMALQEVQTMFDDAMQRNNKYGQGIAYFTMGNVHLNMNNLDESEAAYRKGLTLLSEIRPLPGQLAELYSYYGDVLNEQRKFAQLDSLTMSWSEYIPRFISEKHFTDDQNKTEIDILWFYYDIACAQASLGLHQLDRAERMLADARSRFDGEASYQGMAWLTCASQLRLQQGRYAEALDCNTRRLRLTSADEDRAVYLTIIAQRADILSALHRYEEAAALYKEMYTLRDSISSADTKTQLNEMNTLFRVGELEHERERAQFRAVLIIVGIIVVALGVFLVYRLRAARRLKRAHDQLQATHEKLQSTHDELLSAYDRLEETTAAKERIESDLRIARNIQMSMVPSRFPERPDVDLFASMTPAKEVGGDLYGYHLDGDRLYFALGDVSGKGVPASLFMAQATRLFLTLAAQGMMPAEICTRINDALSGEDNEACMFVTMYVGLIDLTSGRLDFCNAGHNPPVLIGDGRAEFVDMLPNAPIGLYPGLEYEGEEIADITGRPLFVYTDGLNEAENRQQEQFTDERLLDILAAEPFESSQHTIDMLCEAVERHRDGAEPNDDLTMLCVNYIGTNDA